MAKKSARIVEETTTTSALEDAELGTVTLEEENKQKPTKKRTIIAKSVTSFRKTTSLEAKQVVGTMPVGVAYEIVREAKSMIYGSFYQLNNGYYITKNGNYSIN